MDKKIQTALIGGGYVLQVVAKSLSPQHDFVITSRNIETVKKWRALGWRAECLDYSDLRQVESFLKNYPDLTTWIDSVPPSDYTKASVHCLQLHAPSSLKRIIYLSTTGVYGVTNGSWVDETSALNPAHTRAEGRIMAEEAYQQCGITSCALRISGIYGPTRGAGLSLQRGGYPYIEDGQRWSNRIHVHDLANLIIAAIRFPFQQALPKVVNASDDCPALVRDVITFYCEKFQLKFPTSITLDQARAAGMFTVLGNQRVSNKLLHNTFDFTFLYPSYREGAGSEFGSDV
jgi:hypothetical protein